MRSRVSTKGQVVVPREIREHLSIEPGQEVAWELGEGHARLIPLPEDPVEYLTGIFKGYPKSLSRELVEERRREDARS